MEYVATRLGDCVSISSVVTVHYFEYTKNYAFHGESHDFWEFVCVDKGEVVTVTEAGERRLQEGDIIFHAPNEWHNIRASAEGLSSVVIISFHGELPQQFECGGFKVSNTQRLLLSKILNEAACIFESPLGDPYTKNMLLWGDAPLHRQQLLKTYLTEFLLLFLQQEKAVQHLSYSAPIDDNTFAAAVDYMSARLGEPVRLEDIAQHLNISRSSLKNLFRKNVGCGAIEYFNRMRIKAAKDHIRSGEYSLTQIADMLGYSGVQYFSCQFKHITGQSPRAYAQSIKAMLR